MSNLSSPAPLVDTAIAVFGSATSPRPSLPTPQQVKALEAAWRVAPNRYREGLCHYLLECVSRHPNRVELYLEAMPFVDWSFGRGVMPFWAEAILGVPAGGSPGIPGHSAYVSYDAQPSFWDAWTKNRGSKAQVGIISSLLDPYDATPQTLSGQRALWLSKSFMPFVEANVDRPHFRDEVIISAFIPLAHSQSGLTSPPEDPVANSMAGYLAAALSRAWIVDKVQGRTPAWEDWMFEQSKSIWPNFGHLVSGKGSPAHLYGLPEVFLQRVFSLENRKSQAIVDLTAEQLDVIQLGVAKSLEARSAADGRSVWLPSAQALRMTAKEATQLRSFVEGQLMKMEVSLVRRALLNPQQESVRSRPAM